MTEILISIRSYLIELARADNNNVTYYYDIIDMFNLKYNLKVKEDNRKFSKDLSKILKYEIDNNRPCLTILIVNRKYQEGFDVQIPSNGFYYYVEKYRKIGNVEGRVEFFIREKENLINFWKDDTKYNEFKDYEKTTK